MSAVDWASKPPPWCWIGQQFRAECEAISAGDRLPVARRMSEGGRLRLLRINLGLTQDEAAALARVSQSSIKNIENDRGTAQCLSRLATALRKIESDRRLAREQAFA